MAVHKLLKQHADILGHLVDKNTVKGGEFFPALVIKSPVKDVYKRQGLMMPIMGFIGNLGYVAVCITGALLVHSGKIDFSVIVAFMIYVRLFTNPLSQIAQAATNMQSAAAASKRVFDLSLIHI